jgi:GntR family transcriptional regulator, carbon starvation induced regulator
MKLSPKMPKTEITRPAPDQSIANQADASFLSENHKSLTAAVFDAIRADILSGHLRPNSKLPIGALSKRFGVSLSAVREALSRLVSEELVKLEEQRGFRVAPVSIENLLDITKVRIQIEILAIREALEKGDTAWEANILGAAHRLSRTPERDSKDPNRLSEEWAFQHRLFHDALISACGSPWLMRIHDTFFEQTERYRRLSLPYKAHPRGVENEHREIVEAILNRDIDAAASSIANHFQETTNIIIELESHKNNSIFRSQDGPKRPKARVSKAPLHHPSQS